MPSIAQEQQPAMTVQPSKKRRRDESSPQGGAHTSIPDDPSDEHEDPQSMNVSAHEINNSYEVEMSPSHLSHPLARKIIPLPNPKRMRIEDPRRSPEDQQPRTPGRIRRSPSALQQTDANDRTLQAQTSPCGTTTAHLLSPCHICHRKPRKKADLDSFADCQSCGRRACYVCIRECLGWDPRDGDHGTTTHAPRERDWESGDRQKQGGELLPQSFQMEEVGGGGGGGNGEQVTSSEGKSPWSASRVATWQEPHHHASGHRRTICSACCVERGPDGDVVCLGCLPFVDG